MISIGDFVRHQTTGQVGQVVAYGHQIQDEVYLPTLTVRLIKGKRINDLNFVEDFSSLWVLAEGLGIPTLSLDATAAAIAEGVVNH